jgi:hypothetical protein
MESGLRPWDEKLFRWQVNSWPLVGGNMKLAQGQIWQLGTDFYRIVAWERLAIDYKKYHDLDEKTGEHHRVSKKEFCRLIKGAVLVEGLASAGDA